MRIEEPGHRSRAPSLTPLIDVVFILLVFFMLVSSFVKWRSVAVETPPPVTLGAPAQTAATLRLQVHPGGRLLLEGEELALSTVEARIRGLTQPSVTVIPMDGLRLQGLVSVLDRVTAAGAEVSLAEP